MKDDVFQELRDRASLVDVAEHYGLVFNRGKALCPNHDDHNPSLSLHPSGEFAKCFPCGKVYDALELEFKLGNYENRWFAVKALNDRLGLNLRINGIDKKKASEINNYHKFMDWYFRQCMKTLLDNKRALEFLGTRGLSLDDVKRICIGYTGQGFLHNKLKREHRELALKIGLLKEKDGRVYDHFQNRIVFSLRQYGRIVGIWAREFPPKENSEYKWVGLPTSEFIPYKPIPHRENLNCQGVCVVVEGITDMLAFEKVDIPAVALLGSGISSDNDTYFRNAKADLCFILDPDPTGQTAGYKLAVKFRGSIAHLGYDKDADEVLFELGLKRFREVVEKAIENRVHYLAAAIEREKDCKEVLKLIARLEDDTDKDIWLNKLLSKHKSQGVTLKSLKKDLERIEKEQAAKGIVNVNPNAELEEVMTAQFEGLVDLAEHEGKVVFLVKTEDKVEVVNDVVRDDVRYIPPPKEQIPFMLPRADKVLKHYKLDSDSKLYDDLVLYHKQISELPQHPESQGDEYYHLLATWVFHTYCLEAVQYSPYIWLYAIPERGKSRTGKGAIYVARRGIHVESLRDAYLIRVANDFGATLFIDVMNLWKKAEKNGSEDIILLRFEKGATVPRVLYPDRGPHRDTKYFNIFGATIIGTNEPVHSILETRATLISMPETSKTFEDDVMPEMGLSLKERLVGFRARHLREELPETRKPVRGRLGDILKPLLQIILLVKPAKKESFRALIRQIEVERKLQKSDSYEARLLKCIIDLELEVTDELLPIKRITECYNEPLNERFHTSTNRIGWRTNAMGFKKHKRNDGMCIKWDGSLIKTLSVKFGINDEDEEVDEVKGEKPPTHTEEKRHERHERPLSNDDSKLDGDDMSDDVSHDKETSPKRHSVSARNSGRKDDGDDSDDISKGVDARVIGTENRIKNK